MNERLTIQDLTDLLATKHGMTKKGAEAFVKEFFLLIEEALKNENYVKIKGLGTFKLIDVDSRESVNVNTGERFQIKGHTKVSFTPDTNLRDTINKPFSHFETVVLNDNTVLDDTPIEEGEGEEEDAVEETQVQIEEETVAMDEIPQNEVHSEDESTEDTIAEEIIIKNDPIQEIEQQEEEASVSPIEETPKETEFTAEQIIALELLKANMKPENTPIKVQPEIIEPKAEVNTNSAKKEKTPIPFLITAIIIVLLLCGGAILFIYYPDLITSSSNKEALDMPVTPQPEKQDVQFTDTIERADTVAKNITEGPVETAKTQPEVKKETESAVKQGTKEAKESKGTQQLAAPVYSDSATYSITGTKTTHTIKEGESLTKVALKYYGTKALWPYIVKHNAGVIKNPDNVPYGTTIKIPELTKK